MGLTNNASPGEGFVACPGRKSDHFASHPQANHLTANDLRVRAGAKFAEFRLTKKRKNFAEAKMTCQAPTMLSRAGGLFLALPEAIDEPRDRDPDSEDAE
jgi:hypothetical protein